MKKYILSAFLGIAITANAQILNVPAIIQEQSQWCWAAVSKSVLGYYNYPYYSQCEIAEYTRSLRFYDFGTVPCCFSALYGCDYWNFNWYYPGSVQDILAHFGNIYNVGMTDILSISDIQNNISQNRPFIAAWKYSNGAGHAVVGRGIDSNNIVYYMDPTWNVVGGGYQVLSYNNFKKDGTHEWIETNVMLVSPSFPTDDVSSIENVTNMSIFPNPVKDELRIESGELIIKRAEILDIAGKTIYLLNDVKSSINVSALSRGIYFAKFETDKGIETKKFIKE